MKKISIIIPVFNVERYLADCVQSVLNQDMEPNEVEIILINDGSTDNSFEIADKIRRSYSNVKLISQKNAGLSEARNAGLKLATGEYVWFVDSDDKIEKNCFRLIYDKLKKEDLDILAICSAYDYGDRIERRINYDNRINKSGISVLRGLKLAYPAQFYIYRYAFLQKHNLKFYPGVFHEDNEFTPRAVYYAERVGFISEICYYSTMNPNSIMRTYNPKRAFDNITVAASLHNFADGKPEVAQFFHNEISLLINNALFIICAANISENSEYNVGAFRRIIYSNRHLYSHLLKSSYTKYRVEGSLFMIAPKSVISIYKIMQRLKVVKK